MNPSASVSPARATPTRRAFHSLLGVPLCAEDERTYEEERVSHNRRLVRGLAWLLFPVHLLTALAFLQAGKGTGSAEVFRQTVVLLHLGALPGALLLTWLAIRVEPRFQPAGWSGWASDLYNGFYLLLAAGLSTNAQRLNGNVNVFVLVILTCAILFRLRGLPLAIIGLLGTGALITGIVTLVEQSASRIASISLVVTVWLVAIMASRMQAGSARRELASRREAERGRAELARQQAQLQQLNDDLERRVAEQVSEIVAHSEEIESLNRHLRAQIVDRSRQLARAMASLDRARPPLSTGELLDGRVEILARIAAGGMGEVYRGRDRVLERDVAVKVPHADAGMDSDLWRRFAKEAAAAAAVSHPAVVRTLHVAITDEGRLYQLQDLVVGSSLAEILETHRPWPAPAACRIGAVLAEALAAAHLAGIVHRDVKPNNVMLSQSPPGVYLLDFGVSKVRDEAVKTTALGAVVGTPTYMAPEQIAMPDTVAAPADIYALGVLLHEILSGAPPFLGSMSTTMNQHLNKPAPRLEPAIAPAPLADLVCACLDKHAVARPSARQVAERLGAMADEQGVPPAERLVWPPLRPTQGNSDRPDVNAETVRLGPASPAPPNPQNVS